MRTGSIVPPAKTMLLASRTISLKCSVGLRRRYFICTTGRAFTVEDEEEGVAGAGTEERRIRPSASALERERRKDSRRWREAIEAWRVEVDGRLGLARGDVGHASK